jgi:hypothetical protein
MPLGIATLNSHKRSLMVSNCATYPPIRQNYNPPTTYGIALTRHWLIVALLLSTIWKRSSLTAVVG